MTDIMLAVVLTICFVAMAGCVVVLIRNNQVYRFWRNLLSLVSAEGSRRINSGDLISWSDLYAQFNLMNYDEQVIHFWRPLESWLTPELRKLWDDR